MASNKKINHIVKTLFDESTRLFNRKVDPFLADWILRSLAKRLTPKYIAKNYNIRCSFTDFNKKNNTCNYIIWWREKSDAEKESWLIYNYPHYCEKIEIKRYIEQMADWVVNNTEASKNEVIHLFTVHKNEIADLFKPYPETVFHFDPVKYAELFAVELGLKKQTIFLNI